MRETERKCTLIKIEEGAKKFVATNVDDDVKSLSAKLKKFTESELANLLKAEMDKLTALDLTTLKEAYITTKHVYKRMDVIMSTLLPEATAIKQKISLLKDILETTQLTVSQIYEDEFCGTGRNDSAFANTLTRLIALKLGAPMEQGQKKARRTHDASVIRMLNIPLINVVKHPTDQGCLTSHLLGR